MAHCRIYTSSSSGHLVSGMIYRIECKVALDIKMKTTLVMDQWQCSVQHAHSQASIFLRIGRQDIHCMASSPWFKVDCWLILRNQLIHTFIMDGNFSAEHMRCREGDADTLLSAGMAFMANPDAFNTHLLSGQEYSQVCHFIPYASQLMLK